ncbi:hypothetical protein ABZ864_39150 [Streptomyces sp. NPDC047082]|uniref:hypothetical protein n=1 Tax=Streptomyces sp. NPDC047082 TaxID=3155259 RepID=UPI003407AE9F
MGVFARLLGKSKATQETSAAEARTGAEPAGAEAEEVAQETTEDAATGSSEAKGAAGDRDEGTATEADAAKGAAAESAEIPKQQSAEKAADNDAGEGART